MVVSQGQGGKADVQVGQELWVFYAIPPDMAQLRLQFGPNPIYQDSTIVRVVAEQSFVFTAEPGLYWQVKEEKRKTNWWIVGLIGGLVALTLLKVKK